MPFANFPERKSLNMADYSTCGVRCHSGANKPPQNNQTCRFELGAPPSLKINQSRTGYAIFFPKLIRLIIYLRSTL
ncbi:hypothetical protein HanXRQr2_Chr11g0473151 [Helianthus annuus]|uniref:Uncharacterized protein n=1 Tax=Helianthus annuus TaxID=4232 RepID=A0A9K3HLR0_HELAN|nr:hypothetical protein HanXRQr2_Chr11g0473151 [Helianthus annuus]KAJ0507762.1 hypothetical protein HanIR_Chr11g0509791 [Helianthus annuus]KAJ0873769.1 hypothetical protein HanPSC8_Chr11g0456271 [Helianthus annuus]